MMTNNETPAVAARHGASGQGMGAWLLLAVHPFPPTRHGGCMPGFPPHAVTSCAHSA